MKLGAKVTLECKAVAPVLQDFRYTWYKDNKPLTGYNGDSIVIPSAQLQDRGFYNCKVSTRYNSVTSQAAEIVLTGELLSNNISENVYFYCTRVSINIQSTPLTSFYLH